MQNQKAESPRPILRLLRRSAAGAGIAALDAEQHLQQVDPSAQLVLLVEEGHVALALATTSPVVQLAPACACCVGALPLRVQIARALRQWQPTYVLVEIAALEHAERLADTLRRGPLGTAVEVVDFDA